MSFEKKLRSLTKKAKISAYRLATDACVDGAYVMRLLKGERRRPSRYIVLKLGQALLDNSGDISLTDINGLLKEMNYGPLPRNRVSIIDVRR